MVSISRLIFFTLLTTQITACSMGYLIRNAYHQGRLLKSAVPIEDVLEDSKVAETTKNKLRLAAEAKMFAETTLKLKPTKNYSTFVQLDGPYVTYIVSAAPKDELEYYTWYFPIVGSVPYKGYFVKQGALDEAEDLKNEGYDTYVRGVTAFSTLGWFKDPVLSSMLRYEDYELVNTIIHETVHATLYISSNANFNERLATYLGDLGTEIFYKQKKENHPLLEMIKKDSADSKLFSEYISARVKKLEQWYKDNKNNPDLLKLREEQFKLIKEDFKKEVLPRLQTEKYARFHEAELNNARIMGYKLYVNDLSDFAKLSIKLKYNFTDILNYCKSLEGSKDPERSLKDFVNNESSHPRSSQ